MSRESRTSQHRLRLLTLNTHKGFTSFNRRFVLHELREAIRGIGADLVFLQEVVGRHEDFSKRHANWPTTTQYEFLADSIWSDFAYGRNAVHVGGHHGNAVLSKLPIVRHANHDVSMRDRERRGLLHCVMRLPQGGFELHAVCAHLSLSEGQRRRQVARLCDLIDTAVPPAAPLFVAGDFNDWRVLADRRLRSCAGLHEAFRAADEELPRTFPARWPLLKLDRIYVRNARVLTTTCLSDPPWSHLSDHVALAAEVAVG